jgi:phosphate transport system substrate-binding protein
MSTASAKGIILRPAIVAFDALSIIVNQSNGLTGLTQKPLEQIFTGDIADWSAVGGNPRKISIYTRNTSSGTYSDWKELAMKKRDYAGSSQKMAGNEQIAGEVGNNPNGISYAGPAYLKDEGIKALPVDGVFPSATNVKNKSFPYLRPTFFSTNGGPSGTAKEFFAFTLSPAGQAIANQVS